MDVHSTYSAISRGAHEANPLMKGVVDNKGAMMAVKAGVAASTIWMAECDVEEGQPRRARSSTMIVANSVTAVVVAHNYKSVEPARHASGVTSLCRDGPPCPVRPIRCGSLP